MMNIYVSSLQAVLRLTMKWIICLQSEWRIDVFTFSQTQEVSEYMADLECKLSHTDKDVFTVQLNFQ